MKKKLYLRNDLSQFLKQNCPISSEKAHLTHLKITLNLNNKTGSDRFLQLRV